MSELSKEEARRLCDFCNEIMSSLKSYREICNHYAPKDNASFNYLFYFYRVKSSADYGPKQLMKAAKEVKHEIKTIQINERKFQDQLNQVTFSGMVEYVHDVDPPLQEEGQEEDIIFDNPAVN